MKFLECEIIASRNITYWACGRNTRTFWILPFFQTLQRLCTPLTLPPAALNPLSLSLREHKRNSASLMYFCVSNVQDLKAKTTRRKSPTSCQMKKIRCWNFQNSCKGPWSWQNMDNGGFMEFHGSSFKGEKVSESASTFLWLWRGGTLEQVQAPMCRNVLQISKYNRFSKALQQGTL